jgi:hypothetical protein
VVIRKNSIGQMQRKSMHEDERHHGRRHHVNCKLLSKPFIIYTDASKKQIGGLITQDKKPLDFFSNKLTDTQHQYPVTEQELLAIMETLKYFKHMLLNHKIIVKTDHKKFRLTLH